MGSPEEPTGDPIRGRLKEGSPRETLFVDDGIAGQWKKSRGMLAGGCNAGVTFGWGLQSQSAPILVIRAFSRLEGFVCFTQPGLRAADENTPLSIHVNSVHFEIREGSSRNPTKMWDQ
jgi:hypothetical protein